jgi:hypothetical protein
VKIKLLIPICILLLAWSLNGKCSVYQPQDTLTAADTTFSIEEYKEVVQESIKKFKNARLQKLFDTFEKSPGLIITLYTVMAYSIIALILLTIFILIHRKKMENQEELKQKLDEDYQALLLDYLFDENKRIEIFRKLRKIASTQFNRQILINQIIELSVNMQGEAKDHLKNIYIRLKLNKDSLKKAYSKKWHENVKGFRELAFMDIRSANEQMLKCLNSSNQILRMETQIALVRLSDENPYDFLDFLDQPLAIWEQITIHDLLTQHNMDAPDFSHWFKSENLSIIIFSLQMVAWFKQKQSANGVVVLLQHENEKVRNTAIETCGEIELRDALPVLEKMYYDESYKNRGEILLTFGKVPDEKYLDFLNGVLDREDDVQLQIMATKAMENMDEPGIKRLIKLMKSKSEYRNYQIIIRHVLDGRIY